MIRSPFQIQHQACGIKNITHRWSHSTLMPQCRCHVALTQLLEHQKIFIFVWVHTKANPRPLFTTSWETQAVIIITSPDNPNSLLKVPRLWVREDFNGVKRNSTEHEGMESKGPSAKLGFIFLFDFLFFVGSSLFYRGAAGTNKHPDHVPPSLALLGFQPLVM